MSALEKLEYFTATDYFSWGEEVRCELIDGVVYNMASPTINHQRIAARVWKQLDNLLAGRVCEALLSPVDVRLFANHSNKNDDTVVQPDILIVCDKKKYDPNGRGILGAPDVVIEILSPSSTYHDRVLKCKKYQEAGVDEYWLIDPDHKITEVHILENKKYYIIKYGAQDTIPLFTLDDLEIDMALVFSEI
jgi:Uma2 family endonuclease